MIVAYPVEDPASNKAALLKVQSAAESLVEYLRQEFPEKKIQIIVSADRASYLVDNSFLMIGEH